MQEIVEPAKQWKISVAAIGNGTPAMAQDFAEQFSLTFPLYTDPEKHTYAFLGWKRQFGLGWNSFKNSWSAFQSGHRQGSVQGDPWQQGGEALITSSGKIWWSHAANEAGTHAPKEELLTILNRFSMETE